MTEHPTVHPGRRGRTRRHLVHGLFTLVALCLMAAVLTPTGSTQARWHSQATATVPQVTMDTLALALTPTGERTATVTNTAEATTASWAPRSLAGSPLVPGLTTAEQDAALLSKLRVDYRTGGAGAACATSAPQWSATGGGDVAGSAGRAQLLPGASSPVCLEVTPTVSEADLVAAHGGRALTLTTTLDAVSQAPATWSSAPVTWDTTYRVPFPQPELSCSNGGLLWLGTGTLSWTWQSGTHSSGTPAVNRWEVLKLEDGGWVSNGPAGNAAARSVEVGVGDVSWLGRTQFKIRAYPFATSEYYVDSKHVVTFSEGLLGRLRCGTNHDTESEVALP